MFAWGQEQQRAVQREGTAFAVIGQRATLQPRMLAATAAAHQGGQPRFQLFQGKGLGQEIVRAQVQPTHPVLQRALGGQQQHGCTVVTVTHFAQHHQPVLVGQAQVHDDGVIFGACHEGLGRAGVGRVIRHKSALGERAHQPGRHVPFVFNQQYAHDRPFLRANSLLPAAHARAGASSGFRDDAGRGSPTTRSTPGCRRLA
ncbi:hypothetical protein D3C85_1266390 [compost metagenome]